MSNQCSDFLIAYILILMYSFSAADMDARSVMEQRLQAMVCCFSMVQRVLARQPQDDSTVVSASTSTSSSTSTSTSSSSNNSGCTTQSESSKKIGTSINTPYNIDCSTNNHSTSSSNSSSGNSNSTLPECEQGFEGKLPTRTVSAAEATERIWKYLSAVPSLMEVRISGVQCVVDFCILLHVQMLTNI
jgi:hypothetical protein